MKQRRETGLPSAAAAVAAILLSGCTSVRAPANAAGPLDQPATDVGLLQAKAPDVLLRAAASPYAPLQRCAKIRAEQVLLDEVLGPDLDTPALSPSASDTASALASDLIGGLLPYRAIVRRLTGATAREEDLERAVMAGIARRGFLRGLARARRCAARVG